MGRRLLNMLVVSNANKQHFSLGVEAAFFMGKTSWRHSYENSISYWTRQCWCLERQPDSKEHFLLFQQGFSELSSMSPNKLAALFDGLSPSATLRQTDLARGMWRSVCQRTGFTTTVYAHISVNVPSRFETLTSNSALIINDIYIY